MKLNLFSSSYPYGNGEQFLGKEIEYLSTKFELINLYPFYYSSSDEQKRVVPQNVIVHDPVIPNQKFKRIILFLRNFFFAKNKTIFFKEFFAFKVYLSRKRFLSWLINFTGFIILSGNENFKKLKKEKDSIFYFYWGYGWALSIILFENYNNNKFYLRLHGSDIFLDRNDYYIPVRKEIFSKINYFIPISKTVKEYLVDNFQISEDKIIVSYLGSDFQSLNPNPISDTFRIVSVSQLIPLKRVDLIIDILSNLDHSVEWVHFGDGFKKDKIIHYAKNKLPKNVSFKFMGFVLNKEVLKYFKTTPVDVLINTSRYEGLPYSIIEAMSYGIPCIATSAGATKEIVNNFNGLLLPIDFDVNYVSQELSYDSKKKWFNKRKLAFNTWGSKFNSQKNYETLFRNLTQDSADD